MLFHWSGYYKLSCSVVLDIGQGIQIFDHVSRYWSWCQDIGQVTRCWSRCLDVKSNSWYWCWCLDIELGVNMLTQASACHTGVWKLDHMSLYWTLSEYGLRCPARGSVVWIMVQVSWCELRCLHIGPSVWILFWMSGNWLTYPDISAGDKMSRYWLRCLDIAPGVCILAQWPDFLKYHIYIYCHLWQNQLIMTFFFVCSRGIYSIHMVPKIEQQFVFWWIMWFPQFFVGEFILLYSIKVYIALKRFLKNRPIRGVCYVFLADLMSQCNLCKHHFVIRVCVYHSVQATILIHMHQTLQTCAAYVTWVCTSNVLAKSWVFIIEKRCFYFPLMPVMFWNTTVSGFWFYTYVYIICIGLYHLKSQSHIFVIW